MKKRGLTKQCNICDASFKITQELNKHIESVHERKKPFDCTQCDAKFSLQQVKITILHLFTNQKSLSAANVIKNLLQNVVLSYILNLSMSLGSLNVFNVAENFR